MQQIVLSCIVKYQTKWILSHFEFLWYSNCLIKEEMWSAFRVKCFHDYSFWCSAPHPVAQSDSSVLASVFLYLCDISPNHFIIKALRIGVNIVKVDWWEDLFRREQTMPAIKLVDFDCLCVRPLQSLLWPDPLSAAECCCWVYFNSRPLSSVFLFHVRPTRCNNRKMTKKANALLDLNTFRPNLVGFKFWFPMI